MIKSREELKRHIHQDRVMNGYYENKSFLCKIARFFIPNLIIKFLYYLRMEEYYTNMGGFLKYYYIYKTRRLGMKLGFSIPANVFGAGLSLPHTGTIVVSKYARIGDNCRLHVCTNIGASAGKQGAPKLGNNCYIGPGAILFGEIQIADNTTIAANATVNKSSSKTNVVLARSPAKVVKENYDSWIVFNNVKTQ